MADVQMGFGAFLAFYLADQGWSKQDVGLALTIGGVAGVAAQIPGGALADAVRWKRGLAALGIVAIAVSALMLAWRPTLPIVFAAEVLHGITGGIVGTAIAAISLGLAGRHGMSARVGRNYRFAAIGNALTAAVMGAVGTYLSNSAIFIAAAILCIPALIALGQIRANEIDYARARNATKRDDIVRVERVLNLAKNKNLLLFASCLVMFHFSNASMLPLIGQNLGQSKTDTGPLFMAGLVIGPQIIVAMLAPWIGYWSELWGRKPLLLIGFGTEALRGVLFTLITDPSLLIMVQLVGWTHWSDRDGIDDTDHHGSDDGYRALQLGARSGRHNNRDRCRNEHDGHGIHRQPVRGRGRVSRDGHRYRGGDRPGMGLPARNQTSGISGLSA